MRNFADDDEGQWAIFCRILLSDEVSQEPQRQEIVTRVVRGISASLESGVEPSPYFEFRSLSEQARLNQPGWD